MKNISGLFAVSISAGVICWSADAAAPDQPGNLDQFRPAAEKANALLTIPEWEQTPEAVKSAMMDAIAKANQKLDEIGKQDPKKVTFKSTVVALDDLGYDAFVT